MEIDGASKSQKPPWALYWVSILIMAIISGFFVGEITRYNIMVAYTDCVVRFNDTAKCVDASGLFGYVKP